jgi:circadian clock protein KaiB
MALAGRGRPGRGWAYVCRDGLLVASGAFYAWAIVSGSRRPVSAFHFRLYVAGKTERTDAALVNIRMICESRLPDGYDLEVIDALERPDLAEGDAVLIAPTVVRVTPSPQRRVYGDLSDHARASAALGLADLADAEAGDR